jgi:hypothetical protein
MQKWREHGKKCTCLYREYTPALRPSGVKPAKLAAAASRSTFSRSAIVTKVTEDKKVPVGACLQALADCLKEERGGCCS